MFLHPQHQPITSTTNDYHSDGTALGSGQGAGAKIYLEVDMQVQRSRLAAGWLAANVVIVADLSFTVPAVGALIKPAHVIDRNNDVELFE